jgi:hypothetical protein
LLAEAFCEPTQFNGDIKPLELSPDEDGATQFRGNLIRDGGTSAM